MSKLINAFTRTLYFSIRERWTKWYGLPYFPNWRRSSAVRLCLIEQAKEMVDLPSLKNVSTVRRRSVLETAAAA
ncbi:hypothetical protein L6452_35459 [Arctium lappa]|uniref:Uncharacterized protein n=1 Tax=Arctium lappa TaxID=4217 RepID=A0ACB8Y7B0_ARCLA|nr:hypothetical protein L6452_35459 [Arctium lappa]